MQLWSHFDEAQSVRINEGGFRITVRMQNNVCAQIEYPAYKPKDGFWLFSTL